MVIKSRLTAACEHDAAVRGDGEFEYGSNLAGHELIMDTRCCLSGLLWKFVLGRL